MSDLIIGGTSGMGLELARDFAETGDKVIITGRHDPKIDFAEYREFDLGQAELPRRIGEFVVGLPVIDTFVYAPGFFQEGHITDLSDDNVDKMFDVGGRGLLFFVKKLLEKQGTLNELIVITSTSERVAREFEPVYNFVKAGGGLYTNAQSLDPAVGKTMKVLVSGMDTSFWHGQDKDTSNMLKPNWVAEQIMAQRPLVKNYRPVDILGPIDKKRVEVDVAQER